MQNTPASPHHQIAGNQEKRLSIHDNPSLLRRMSERFLDWMEVLLAKNSLVGNPPVFDNSIFPWAKEIEAEWHKIRAELDKVMERREELPNFHDITSEVKTITSDNNWKTFFLYGYGQKVEENVRQCPETARLLKKIPGMTTAFFSILSPGKHIPAHRGPYNGVLRFHLGLIVPEPREKVRIRIDNQICHWEEGKALIFDDAYNHEVWNDTDFHRVVLFVDFIRPCRPLANLLNKLVISIATLTPLIQDARKNHRKWEEKFHAKKN